jgi:hypothetical protein
MDKEYWSTKYIGEFFTRPCQIRDALGTSYHRFGTEHISSPGWSHRRRSGQQQLHDPCHGICSQRLLFLQLEQTSLLDRHHCNDGLQCKRRHRIGRRQRCCFESFRFVLRPGTYLPILASITGNVVFRVCSDEWKSMYERMQRTAYPPKGQSRTSLLSLGATAAAESHTEPPL